MSNAPWTPGPWKWDAGLVPPDGPQFYATIYASDDPDLIIAEFNNRITEGTANARLIAEAPAMAEALECAEQYMERMAKWMRPEMMLSEDYNALKWRLEAILARINGGTP